MKVKCIAIFDSYSGSALEKSPWLTVGTVYSVLSVFVAEEKPAEYRLLADDGFTPGMYRADQFELVSNVIPANWVVNFEAGLYFELAPRAWLKDGFWEEYFDGNPIAIESFESEKNEIFKLSE